MDLRCWWCAGTEGKFTSFRKMKVVHWSCIPKIIAAQQSVQLAALRRGWRARLSNWLVSLGERIAQSGGN